MNIRETRNLKKKPPINFLQLCPTHSNDKALGTLAWRERRYWWNERRNQNTITEVQRNSQKQPGSGAFP